MNLTVKELKGEEIADALVLEGDATKILYAGQSFNLHQVLGEGGKVTLLLDSPMGESISIEIS